MAKRVCIDCPTLIAKGSRCPACSSQRERTRGSSTQRGYDSKHRTLRAAWQRRLDAGELIWCWRCLKHGVRTRIDPRHWQLGHDDHDRSKYRGPECPPCNLASRTKDRRPDSPPDSP